MGQSLPRCDCCAELLRFERAAYPVHSCSSSAPGAATVDRNDVHTHRMPGKFVVTHDEVTRCANDALLFAARHACGSTAMGAPCPISHLDEYDRVAVSGNEVYFAESAVVVASQDLQARRFEMSGGNVFPALTDLGLTARQRRESATGSGRPVPNSDRSSEPSAGGISSSSSTLRPRNCANGRSR